MEPADGVDDAVITTHSRWRGALVGAGLGFAVGLIALLAPAPAHADDGHGLLGGIVSGVTSTVGGVTSGVTSTVSGATGAVSGIVAPAVTPVVAPVVNTVAPVVSPVPTPVVNVVAPVVAPLANPLPTIRQLPVVGGIVGGVVDSAPVASVTTPVAGLVDGLLGTTVGSLPVIGGVLGTTPVGSLTQPISGAVDGALGQLAGTPLLPGPVLGGVLPDGTVDPAIAADPDGALALPASLQAVREAAVRAAFAGVGIASAAAPAVLSAPSPLGGAGGPLPGGFSGLLGEGIAIVSAAAAAAAPWAKPLAILLGAAFVFLLAAGRIRPVRIALPASLAFGTDTSPD